eukprot:TRINITY_DN41646_c0_g1_i1.p2 TRINITY_DN41646_c0_g1~~TRINITY_DN41646_c0_g1_i1.p2  ORF type:complete len:116 (-),score=26.49 TRINITY_DN41646_c0_g1_i1:122-469(-)
MTREIAMLLGCELVPVRNTRITIEGDEPADPAEVIQMNEKTKMVKVKVLEGPKADSVVTRPAAYFEAPKALGVVPPPGATAEASAVAATASADTAVPALREKAEMKRVFGSETVF